MEERKLHIAYLGNGITLWEDADTDYKGHISTDRKVSLYDQERPFTPGNLAKIHELAERGNMIYSNDPGKFGSLILNPVNHPVKEHINPITDEVYKLSIEHVDGKEYVCYGRTIFSDQPEKYKNIPQIVNPKNKKFELTEYTKDIDGHILYRIRALRDIDGVKAGDLGGYIEHEHNLSQHDECWIHGSSQVFGLAYVGENARISDSIIYGNAQILGRSKVIQSTIYGESQIKDSVIASNAYIYYKSRIEGHSRVSGHLAFNGIIKDDVFIMDNRCHITGENIELSGSTRIRGKVMIEDSAKIRGQVCLMDNVIITGHAELTGSMEGEGIIIKDNSLIGGKSRIWDNVVISDSAKVLGMALLRENVSVSGNAKILDAPELSGNAKVKDSAVVSGCANISGSVMISDFSKVSDYAILGGSVILSDKSQVGGNAILGGHLHLQDTACIQGDVRTEVSAIISGDVTLKSQNSLYKYLSPNHVSTERTL